MLEKAGDCWAGEKVSERVRYEEKMAVAYLESQV